MQITTKQAKEREISAKYISLQQSGECLSQIQRFSQKDLHPKPLQFQSIDQRELVLTMVQAIYLLYMGHCNKTSFRLSKQVYVRHIQEGMHSVYILYLLQEHYYALNYQHQAYVNKYFDVCEAASQESYLMLQVSRLIDSFYGKMYAYSQRFPEYLRKVYKQPFQEFFFLLNQLINPNIKLFKDSRMLMDCMEKTQLFRDNSLLLNIKMNLLYDKLRPFIAQGKLFDELYQLQVKFQQELKKTKVKSSRIKVIAVFLGAILKILIDINVLAISSSIQDQKNKQKNQKDAQALKDIQNKVPLKLKEEGYTDKWQFFAKAHIFPLNPSNFMQYINDPDLQAHQRTNRTQIKNKSSNYLLEIDHQRQIINLRILCPISVGLDNIDSILHQIESVGQQWYYPTFQLIDGNSALNFSQIQKKLVLSISFRIFPGRSTIARLLTLIDVLLVNQKAFLAELNKPPYKRKNPHKYNNSNEVISRMQHILLKNIERVYEAQLTPQNDE